MLQGKISEARYKSSCLFDGCYEHMLLDKLVYFQKTELITKLQCNLACLIYLKNTSSYQLQRK